MNVTVKLLYVPIDNITVGDSYKNEDYYYRNKLKNSILKFGQVRPISVYTTDNRSFTILEGSKIYQALKDTNSPVVLCNVYYDLSEDLKQILPLLLSMDRFTLDYPSIVNKILSVNETELEQVLSWLPLTYDELAHIKAKLEDTSDEMKQLRKKIVSVEQTRLLL